MVEARDPAMVPGDSDHSNAAGQVAKLGQMLIVTVQVAYATPRSAVGAGPRPS
jgi:hypothetical protein